MKNYPAKDIRNICLASHNGVGKTSLMEAVTYTSGMSRELGSVDKGNSIFDTRTDEKKRKMTLSMGVGSFEWEGKKINIIDNPGFMDFLGDVKASIRAVESAVILVDAASGVEVGTEIVNRIFDEAGLPRMFFLNGIDKDNVNFQNLISSLKESFGTSVAPIQIPIGTGSDLKGVVDLITNEAYEYELNGDGKGKKIDVPSDVSEMVESMRKELMEAVAESDEELMEKYCEAGELSEADFSEGLAKGIAAGLVFPVLCGSAPHTVGIDHFLSNVINLCPAADNTRQIPVKDGDDIKKTDIPEACCSFVFKTISEAHVGEINIIRVFSGEVNTGSSLSNSTRGTHERIGNIYQLCGKNRTDTDTLSAGDIGGLLKLKDTHTGDTLVDKSLDIEIKPVIFDEPLVSVAITPKSKGGEDKIGTGLTKLGEEDPTFSYEFHSDIRQSILSAMGDIHINVILQNLKERFGVEVDKASPKISYRETVTKPVKYVEYTHKKQTGGAGQFARVFINLEPLERGKGYEFVDKIVGGVIDQSLRPSVDKGIRVKIEEGIYAGYPIVDVKVSLVDGKTHPVDSKDVAFQIAGRKVFRKAFEMAGPIMLEPVVDLKVTVPDEYTGDVMGGISSRRGRVSGMDPAGKYQVINAKIPESEIQDYSQYLRSITHGRGFYSKTFSHYENVPHEVAQKIISSSDDSDKE